MLFTTAYRRVVLYFHSAVYDAVRASRNVIFSHAKHCCICMEPAEFFFFFLLILVIAYTIQGPRRNKTLLWLVSDGLWRVCKINGRFGSASPSIDFTPPPPHISLDRLELTK